MAGTGPKKPRASTKKTKPSGGARTSERRSASDLLESIRATGLLADLDAARLGELRVTLTRASDLSEAIEAHYRGGARDVVLRSPQSTNDLLAVENPNVAGVVTADVEPRIAHVAGSMYAPMTFHEWAGTFNLALHHLGDERRFVALHVRDSDEPLYVLATPTQTAALRDADVLAWNSEQVRAPARLSTGERAASLAKGLAAKGAPAKSDGDEVVLEFADEAAAIAFVERLRKDVHHLQRVDVLVKAEYVAMMEEPPP